MTPTTRTTRWLAALALLAGVAACQPPAPLPEPQPGDAGRALPSDPNPMADAAPTPLPNPDPPRANRQPPIEPAPEPEPEPDPDAGPRGAPCEDDAHCGSELVWAACRADVCVFDPEGRTTRVASLGPSWPVYQSTGRLKALLQRQIERDALNLLLTNAGDGMYLIQGERAGEYDVEGRLWPLYRQVPRLPVERLDGDGWDCIEDVCAASASAGDEPIDLWLPTGAPAGQARCGYDRLSVQLMVDAEVQRAPGLNVRGGEQSALSWVLSLDAAQGMPFGETTLAAALQAERPLHAGPPDELADLNGDGQPDAWRFRFAIDLAPVGLARAPHEDPEARPPNCF